MSALGMTAAVLFWLAWIAVVVHGLHAQVVSDRADARSLARSRAVRRAMGRAANGGRP